jgi:hypothetical protein
MDPYIEAMGLWDSFRASLLVNCTGLLNQHLPEHFVSQIRTRIDPRTDDRERWIEIKRLPDLELVTVIEFLSPTNKAGAGRDDYLDKLASLIARPVHVVEIDLLLGGHRTPLGKPLPPHHYRAFIARADRRPDAQVYSWTIRHPLPTLPIPLRAPDADVMFPLGEAFPMTYRLGRFDRLVRHGTPLPEGIPLGRDDRQWAEALRH